MTKKNKVLNYDLIFETDIFLGEQSKHFLFCFVTRILSEQGNLYQRKQKEHVKGRGVAQWLEHRPVP